MLPKVSFAPSHYALSLKQTTFSNGKYIKVFYFNGKATVDEHICSHSVKATLLLLGVFVNYLLFMASPDPGSAKAHKLSLPLPNYTKMAAHLRC